MLSFASVLDTRCDTIYYERQVNLVTEMQLGQVGQQQNSNFFEMFNSRTGSE